jgi:hypothetical protein
MAGSLMAGLLIFRSAIVIPDHPAFQCITVGALTAGVLALVRIRCHGQAVVLMIAFALLRLGLVQSRGWLVALSGLLLAAGIYLTSLIFDLLGRKGLIFGKFLILGPLVGGLYLALTPMTEFSTLTSNGVMYVLMEHVLLGVVIGDGVGLGVEVAELLGLAQQKSRR